MLCFDEFQSVKRGAGAMSVIMMDDQTWQLLEIVANRQLPHLEAFLPIILERRSPSCTRSFRIFTVRRLL